MRLMGIDYGTKRVGIALTDEGGSMAFPHIVLDNDAKLLERLEKIIEEREVKEIVIGHSLDRSGQANKVHSEVEELIGDLTLRVGLPIHLEPEQYSTQEALRDQGRTTQTDASAAAIILNSFLTKKK
ncbi:MAG: Holliday junction resolvase RuvX [Candidatus Pacebacteria bacterium]|nr:Holliday junction resolvase RuvX [Candidatus Paceibacterota bacterium]